MKRHVRAPDGATFFQRLPQLRYYGQGQNRARPAPGTVKMWDEYNKWKRDNPEAQEAALRGGLTSGSPETIRREIAPLYPHLPYRPGDPAPPNQAGEEHP